MIATTCRDPLAGQHVKSLDSTIASAEGNRSFGKLVLAGCQRLLGTSETPPAFSVAQCLEGGIKMTELKRAVSWMQRVPSSDKLSLLQLELTDAALQKEAFTSNTKDTTFLKRPKATALAATGRTGDALKLFQELLSQSPEDILIRRAMATALGTPSGDPKNALQQWRWIASRTSARSNLWFQAKYESARMLVTLDRKQEAQKLLRFIQAVPPGWEKSKYRNQFEKLLLECR